MVKDKTNKQTNKQTNKNLTTNIPRSAKLKKSSVQEKLDECIYAIVTLGKRGIDLSENDLRHKILLINQSKAETKNYCNTVMGVSCGDGGKYDSSIQFVDQTPYGKWRMAGGRCGRDDVYDHNCSAGCKGSNGSIGVYVCR